VPKFKLNNFSSIYWLIKKPFLIQVGLFLYLFVVGNSPNLSAQKFRYPNGETATYDISYNWGFIWVTAGWVTFTSKDTTYAGIPSYHFSGIGQTYPKYSWIYKVDDYYQSYVRRSDLAPLYFERNVSEGSTRIYERYIYDYKKNVVRIKRQYQKDPLLYDTINLQKPVNDIMTMLYASRQLEYNNLKINDTIPISFILDGAVHKSYIRYLGKENKKVDGIGTVRCVKFKPLLVEGTIFNGGEDMTVWISDDEQKVPIHVETPILVGWIKAIIRDYQGLAKPLPIVYLE
jgi:hypothetical protein